jgi:hypothetical protein
VISGPWFALKEWQRHPRTIAIDRAYYQPDPDYISLGWLRPDGGRRVDQGAGREPPAIVTEAGESGSIFLADYNGPTEAADTVRLHPDNMIPATELKDELRRHAVAIGYRTSALVTAALMGLKAVVRDSRNIMARDNWRELLPYADWNHAEIESGAAVEHLMSGLDK